MKMIQLQLIQDPVGKENQFIKWTCDSYTWSINIVYMSRRCKNIVNMYIITINEKYASSVKIA